MSVPVMALFNNKGGVGKTSLVYHLSWMFSDLGVKVLAVDLDPQANLTAAFLGEERIEELMPESGDKHQNTIFGSIHPLLRGIGDIQQPTIEMLNDNLSILIGDLMLSSFEDELSKLWPDSLDRKERAFRVLSAFWRLMQAAAAQKNSDLIIVDLGPNLGAINRIALISSDFLIVPLAPDLYSIQGLENIGPTIRRWREEWQERLIKNPIPEELFLPTGSIKPLGYIIMQHAMRRDRPTKSYDRWIARIPQVYRSEILNQEAKEGTNVTNDSHCLALIKHYRSLMPMAQEFRKPMFFLNSANGAFGGHLNAVKNCYQDFKGLAYTIAKHADISIPSIDSSQGMIDFN